MVRTKCMESTANRVIEAEQAKKSAMLAVPLYPHSSAYAHEHNEKEAYRNSHKANVACKDAIETAISDHHANNSLRRTSNNINQIAKRTNETGRISPDDAEQAVFYALKGGYRLVDTATTVI